MSPVDELANIRASQVQRKCFGNDIDRLTHGLSGEPPRAEYAEYDLRRAMDKLAECVGAEQARKLTQEAMNEVLGS